MAPLASIVGAEDSSSITRGYASTVPHAENMSTTRPITNRHRVSSHALYQSISSLRVNGFQKDFLQRDGHDVHGRGVQRARLVENPFGSCARQHGEHATLAP